MFAVLAAWFLILRTPEPDSSIPKAGLIDVRGEIVCLPHRDTSGPQTLECAYGLHADDDNYYMLRDEVATSGPSAITTLETGTRVNVTGQFVPEKNERYTTIGIISFDNIVMIDSNSSPEEVHSDGTITFTIPKNFGLAVSDEQILVDAVIPPCDQGFMYCVYYLGNDQERTNLASAGVAIQRRDDLTTKTTCLETPPDGYSSMIPTDMSAAEGYVMTIFTPLEDAGAGHYSIGSVYRLHTDNSCYQFTTRIGETQFENYPEGTISKFTTNNRKSLMHTLEEIISHITLNKTNQPLVTPKIET